MEYLWPGVPTGRLLSVKFSLNRIDFGGVGEFLVTLGLIFAILTSINYISA